MNAPTDDRSGTTWVDVPEAPPIPGLRFRRSHRDDADYAAGARVACAAALVDEIPWQPTPEHIRDDWEQPSTLDPIDDLLLAEIDGTVVGYGVVSRMVRDGVTVFSLDGSVHPDHRRRGIGGAIFAHDLRRAEARAATEPPEAAIDFGAFAQETEHAFIAMIEANGFRPVRWFHLMGRDLHQAIPDAPLPDGLEIRPLTADHYRAVLDAETEAFRDHWGAHDPTPETFDQTYGKKEFEPDLWVVAWAGDEVAGVVQNWIWADENVALGVRRGWLEHISVRRPWRRIGLARAITAESLRRLAARGLDEGMLGVDADNPNGALGLYLGLGFTVVSRSFPYRREYARPTTPTDRDAVPDRV